MFKFTHWIIYSLQHVWDFSVSLAVYWSDICGCGIALASTLDNLTHQDFKFWQKEPLNQKKHPEYYTSSFIDVGFFVAKRKVTSIV